MHTKAATDCGLHKTFHCLRRTIVDEIEQLLRGALSVIFEQRGLLRSQSTRHLGNAL
jgi:hypothetical protein